MEKRWEVGWGEAAGRVGWGPCGGDLGGWVGRRVDGSGEH